MTDLLDEKADVPEVTVTGQLAVAVEAARGDTRDAEVAPGSIHELA